MEFEFTNLNADADELECQWSEIKCLRGGGIFHNQSVRPWVHSDGVWALVPINYHGH